MVVATITVKFKELPHFGSSSISPGAQLRPPESDHALRSAVQKGSRDAEGDKHGGSSTGRPSMLMEQNDGDVTVNRTQDD